MHGAYEMYHIDGKLLERGTYKNGKLDGAYESYNDNYDTMHPRDSSINRIPPIPEKKDSYWHDALSRTKGRQKTIETYKDGILNGSYMEYHANGQLKAKVIYKNGKEDGTYEWYWKNGQLHLKRSY